MRRLLAVHAMLLMAASGVAGALHHATVRHATCPEHGEAVHLTGGGTATEAHPGRNTQVAPLAPGSGDEERDAHCLAAAGQRQRAPSPARFELAPRLAGEVAPRPDASFVPLAGSTYRLAPKHSPPA